MRLKLTQRILAALLVVTFVTTEASYAAPLVISQTTAGTSEAWLNDPSLIEAPLDWTTLQELHKGSSQKLIIHIQDAHANLSGQENLAHALDFLMTKYGVKLVLSEGGVDDCSLTPLKNIAPPDVWKRVAKKHLVMGNITGEEYLNLVSEHPMKIIGLEDMKLYMTSVRNYAELADQREAILTYLKSIERSLEKLKQKVYPADIREYESALSEKNLNYEERFRRLFTIAGQRGVSMEEFPSLEKMLELTLKEKLINFDQANLERAALLEEIAQKGGGSDIEAALAAFSRAKNAKLAQFVLFQKTLNIAKEKSLLLSKYPEFVKYGEYLEFFSALDLEGVLDELESAEDKLYVKALPNNDTKLIRSIDRYLKLLGTAYNIQMTTKEFSLFRANEPDFATEAYLSFLNRKLMEAGYFQDVIPYQDVFEKGQVSLEAFYDSVSQRDLAFIQNTENALAKENEKVAVLITGGYHTSHLKKLFKEKGYSYVVLTPVVTSETNQAKYEKLLLEPVKKETKTVDMVNGRYKNTRPSGEKARQQLAMMNSGSRLTDLISEVVSPGEAQRILSSLPERSVAESSSQPTGVVSADDFIVAPGLLRSPSPDPSVFAKSFTFPEGARLSLADIMKTEYEAGHGGMTAAYFIPEAGSAESTKVLLAPYNQLQNVPIVDGDTSNARYLNAITQKSKGSFLNQGNKEFVNPDVLSLGKYLDVLLWDKDPANPDTLKTMEIAQINSLYSVMLGYSQFLLQKFAFDRTNNRALLHKDFPYLDTKLMAENGLDNLGPLDTEFLLKIAHITNAAEALWWNWHNAYVRALDDPNFNATPEEKADFVNVKNERIEKYLLDSEREDNVGQGEFLSGLLAELWSVSDQLKPFLIQNRLSGKTLHATLREPTAAQFLKQDAANLLESLYEFHQKGMIHRDLKPGNVWMSEYDVTKPEDRPRPMIVDFGLVKIDLQSGGYRLSETEKALLNELERRMSWGAPGTPGYIPTVYDRRDEEYMFNFMNGRYRDIYAMGVTIAEMYGVTLPQFENRYGDMADTAIQNELKSRQDQIESAIAATVPEDVKEVLTAMIRIDLREIALWEDQNRSNMLVWANNKLSSSGARLVEQKSETYLETAKEVQDIFLKEFPDEDQEMMLAFFGELVILDKAAFQFLKKLMSVKEKPLSYEKAIYYASLMDMANDIENKTSLHIPFEKVSDDFLKWAVHSNSIPAQYFTRAHRIHSNYREKNPVQRLNGKAGQALIKEVFSKKPEIERAVRSHEVMLDSMDLYALRQAKDAAIQETALALGINDPENIRIAYGVEDDLVKVFVLTKNKALFDKNQVSVQGYEKNIEEPDLIPIAYSLIRMNGEVPLIGIVQKLVSVSDRSKSAPTVVNENLKELRDYTDKLTVMLLQLSMKNTELFLEGRRAQPAVMLTPAMQLKFKGSDFSPNTASTYYYQMAKQIGSLELRPLAQPLAFFRERKDSQVHFAWQSKDSGARMALQPTVTASEIDNAKDVLNRTFIKDLNLLKEWISKPQAFEKKNSKKVLEELSEFKSRLSLLVKRQTGIVLEEAQIATLNFEDIPLDKKTGSSKEVFQALFLFEDNKGIPRVLTVQIAIKNPYNGSEISDEEINKIIRLNEGDIDSLLAPIFLRAYRDREGKIEVYFEEWIEGEPVKEAALSTGPLTNEEVKKIAETWTRVGRKLSNNVNFDNFPSDLNAGNTLFYSARKKNALRFNVVDLGGTKQATPASFIQGLVDNYVIGDGKHSAKALDRDEAIYSILYGIYDGFDNDNTVMAKFLDLALTGPRDNLLGIDTRKAVEDMLSFIQTEGARLATGVGVIGQEPAAQLEDLRAVVHELRESAISGNVAPQEIVAALERLLVRIGIHSKTVKEEASRVRKAGDNNLANRFNEIYWRLQKINEWVSEAEDRLVGQGMLPKNAILPIIDALEDKITRIEYQVIHVVSPLGEGGMTRVSEVKLANGQSAAHLVPKIKTSFFTPDGQAIGAEGFVGLVNIWDWYVGMQRKPDENDKDAMDKYETDQKLMESSTRTQATLRIFDIMRFLAYIELMEYMTEKIRPGPEARVASLLSGTDPGIRREIMDKIDALKARLDSNEDLHTVLLGAEARYLDSMMRDDEIFMDQKLFKDIFKSGNRGVDLHTAIRNYNVFWTYSQKTDILLKIARAIDEYSKVGIVHRDLKPENIRVDIDPRTGNVSELIIFDFGLAALDQFREGNIMQREGEDRFRATRASVAFEKALGYGVGTMGFISLANMFDVARARVPQRDDMALRLIAFELLVSYASWTREVPGDVRDLRLLVDIRADIENDEELKKKENLVLQDALLALFDMTENASGNYAGTPNLMSLPGNFDETVAMIEGLHEIAQEAETVDLGARLATLNSAEMRIISKIKDKADFVKALELLETNSPEMYGDKASTLVLMRLFSLILETRPALASAITFSTDGGQSFARLDREFMADSANKMNFLRFVSETKEKVLSVIKLENAPAPTAPKAVFQDWASDDVIKVTNYKFRISIVQNKLVLTEVGNGGVKVGIKNDELNGESAQVFNLGRSLENDIAVDDETVSKRHLAIIIRRDEQGRPLVSLQDKGSKAGTYLNGVKVDRADLLESKKAQPKPVLPMTGPEIMAANNRFLKLANFQPTNDAMIGNIALYRQDYTDIIYHRDTGVILAAGTKTAYPHEVAARIYRLSYGALQMDAGLPEVLKAAMEIYNADAMDQKLKEYIKSGIIQEVAVDGITVYEVEDDEFDSKEEAVMAAKVVEAARENKKWAEKIAEDRAKDAAIRLRVQGLHQLLKKRIDGRIESAIRGDIEKGFASFIPGPETGKALTYLFEAIREDALKINIDLNINREMSFKTVAFAYMCLSAVEQMAKSTELLSNERIKTPIRIFIGKIMPSEKRLGFAHIDQTIGEIGLGASIVGDSVERTREVIAHELVHKLSTRENIAGTDLLFPIADWIAMLKLNGYTTVVPYGTQLSQSIDDYLSVSKHGFATVKKRIRRLRSKDFPFDKLSLLQRTSYKLRANSSGYNIDYLRDPHEWITFGLTSSRAKYFGQDMTSTQKILRKNFTRSKDKTQYYIFDEDSEGWMALLAPIEKAGARLAATPKESLDDKIARLESSITAPASIFPAGKYKHIDAIDGAVRIFPIADIHGDIRALIFMLAKMGLIKGDYDSILDVTSEEIRKIVDNIADYVQYEKGDVVVFEGDLVDTHLPNGSAGLNQEREDIFGSDNPNLDVLKLVYGMKKAAEPKGALVSLIFGNHEEVVIKTLRVLDTHPTFTDEDLFEEAAVIMGQARWSDQWRDDLNKTISELASTYRDPQQAWLKEMLSEFKFVVAVGNNVYTHAGIFNMETIGSLDLLEKRVENLIGRRLEAGAIWELIGYSSQWTTKDVVKNTENRRNLYALFREALKIKADVPMRLSVGHDPRAHSVVRSDDVFQLDTGLSYYYRHSKMEIPEGIGFLRVDGQRGKILSVHHKPAVDPLSDDIPTIVFNQSEDDDPSTILVGDNASTSRRLYHLRLHRQLLSLSGEEKEMMRQTILYTRRRDRSFESRRQARDKVLNQEESWNRLTKEYAGEFFKDHVQTKIDEIVAVIGKGDAYSVEEFRAAVKPITDKMTTEYSEFITRGKTLPYDYEEVIEEYSFAIKMVEVRKAAGARLSEERREINIATEVDLEKALAEGEGKLVTIEFANGQSSGRLKLKRDDQGGLLVRGDGFVVTLLEAQRREFREDNVSSRDLTVAAPGPLAFRNAVKKIVIREPAEETPPSKIDKLSLSDLKSRLMGVAVESILSKFPVSVTYKKMDAQGTMQTFTAQGQLSWQESPRGDLLTMVIVTGEDEKVILHTRQEPDRYPKMPYVTSVVRLSAQEAAIATTRVNPVSPKTLPENVTRKLDEARYFMSLRLKEFITGSEGKVIQDDLSAFYSDLISAEQTLQHFQNRVVSQYEAAPYFLARYLEYLRKPEQKAVNEAYLRARAAETHYGADFERSIASIAGPEYSQKALRNVIDVWNRTFSGHRDFRAITENTPLKEIVPQLIFLSITWNMLEPNSRMSNFQLLTLNSFFGLLRRRFEGEIKRGAAPGLEWKAYLFSQTSLADLIELDSQIRRAEYGSWNLKTGFGARLAGVAQSKITYPYESFERFDAGKAMSKVFTETPAVSQMLSNLYSLNVPSEDIQSVVVKRFAARSRQKEIYQITVAFKGAAGKEEERTFLVYAPSRGTSLGEEKFLKPLAAASTSVPRFGGVYDTEIDTLPNAKTRIPLVAAELVAGKSLFSLQLELTESEKAYFHRQAVKTYFDIYRATGRAIFVDDVALGQVILDRKPDGSWSMKVVDVGIVRTLDPAQVPAEAILELFSGVFQSPIAGMEESDWFWSRRKDKSGFFDAIIDAMGMQEGRAFIEKAALSGRYAAYARAYLQEGIQNYKPLSAVPSKAEADAPTAVPSGMPARPAQSDSDFAQAVVGWIHNNDNQLAQYNFPLSKVLTAYGNLTDPQRPGGALSHESAMRSLWKVALDYKRRQLEAAVQGGLFVMSAGDYLVRQTDTRLAQRFAEVYGARLTDTPLAQGDVKNIDKDLRVLLMRWLLSRDKASISKAIPIVVTTDGKKEFIGTFQLGNLDRVAKTGSVIFNFGNGLEVPLELTQDIFNEASLMPDRGIVQSIQESPDLELTAPILKAVSLHGRFVKTSASARKLLVVAIPVASGEAQTMVQSFFDMVKPVLANDIHLTFVSDSIYKDGKLDIADGKALPENYERLIVMANPSEAIRSAVQGKAGFVPMPQINTKNGKLEMGPYAVAFLLTDMLSSFGPEETANASSNNFVQQMFRLALGPIKYMNLTENERVSLAGTLIQFKNDKDNDFYAKITFELLKPFNLTQVLNAAKLVLQAVGAAA